VFPVVVSTWPFREAVRAAWEVVKAGGAGGSAVDAVVAGCSACEMLRCDGTGPLCCCCSLYNSFMRAVCMCLLGVSCADVDWLWLVACS
jgi:hypothetical protein